MSYTITQETFDDLTSYRDNPKYDLDWSSVFVLPVWMKVWWQEFKPDGEMYLGVVRRDEKVIGIAPLLVKEKAVSFIGSVDVCDYLDFIIAPGEETEFFNVLLDELEEKDIDCLDLRALRPDSTVLTSMVNIAEDRKYKVTNQPEDVSVEMELPPSWEEYMGVLTTKQRHEVRRKLRKILEAGRVEFRELKDSSEIKEALDTFLKMFTESRSDKADFLTPQKESFFRTVADALAKDGLMRIGVLELDSLPTATIMYFDYNGCIYLYNSGYDPSYNSLSAGLMSKVLCIKESIEDGKKKFDFLKGNEAYKYQLGGKEIPLTNCQVTIR